MSVRLHIERLVVEGLPVAQRDRPALAEAVERELARRLAGERGWPVQSAEVRSLRGDSLRLGSGGPAALGTAIAGSIHSAVRP
jgi:hypothetical protein